MVSLIMTVGFKPDSRIDIQSNLRLFAASLSTDSVPATGKSERGGFIWSKKQMKSGL